MSLAICVIEQVGAGFQYVLDTRVSKSPLSWNVHSVQLSGLADSEQTPPRDIVSLGATKGDSTGNFQQEPGNANARQRMTYADGQHAGAERQGFEPWVPLRVLRFSSRVLLTSSAVYLECCAVPTPRLHHKYGVRCQSQCFQSPAYPMVFHCPGTRVQVNGTRSSIASSFTSGQIRVRRWKSTSVRKIT